MAAWGTDDMVAALPDPSTQVNPASQEPAPNEPAADGPKINPQDAGWVPKQAYDYATYSKSNKELQEIHQAQPAAPLENNEEDAVGGLRDGDWFGNAAVYEWNDEYGDVGPKFPALEKQLFGAANHTRTGIKFEKIAMLEVFQEGTQRIKPVMKFENAGLHPVMLENTQLAGYLRPTPIQAYTLPVIFEGKDLIACAQTGSGKTAAFLIPILSKLMGKAKKLCAPRPNPATFQVGVTPTVRAEPLVLIVAPTRELATQIFDEARRFCYRTMFRPCVVYGGGPLGEQIALLSKGCDVLIGTPGRLVDFINRPHLLTLKRLKYMVIDEADEMVQSDWETELKQIMSGGDQEEGNINYLMFSATFPKICQELAEQHLAHNHHRIRVGRAGSTHENIKQDVVFVEAHAKRQCLVDLLMSMPPARTIIFVNSRRTADEVDDFLFNTGFPCTSIHSDRTQREREDSLRSFRKGKSPILIATGVSARGLDIHNVMHVINYDLPSPQYGGIQEYTHRIGRTGRIGNLGLATSFYNSRDSDLAEVLVKTLLETHQQIPDFLHEYIPEGFTADGKGDISTLKFEADEEEQTEETGDGGWGSTEAAPAADGGWGGEAKIPEKPAPGGWGTHPDAAPAVPLVSGGWGAQEPEPAQPAAPPSSGWGVQQAEPVMQPQPASQTWGAPPTIVSAQHVQAPPAAVPQQSAQQPSNTWGAPTPSATIGSPCGLWGQPSGGVPAQSAPSVPWGQPSAPAPQPQAILSSGWGGPSVNQTQRPPVSNAGWAGPPGTQPSVAQVAQQQQQAAPAPAAAKSDPWSQPSGPDPWGAATNSKW